MGRWIAVAAVVIALLAAAGIYGYQVLAAKRVAAGYVSEATVLIESADAIVVQADSVIRQKVTPDLADVARVALTRVPDAQSDLGKAAKLLTQALPVAGDADRKRIGLLLSAANARIEMLDHAPVVLQLNVSASEALPLARAAWDEVISADQLSDKAVASYNKLTKKGVTASRTYNKQAAQRLEAARTSFEAAEKAFPAAPFESYLAYVDARIKLNGLSQQSDTAWLSSDLKKANALISTYNTEDKKAVAQAKQLPVSPDQAIADTYESVAALSTDAYYTARESATVADSSLRAQ
jgi:hypothetical protein